MTGLPTIDTARLHLRAPRATDATVVSELAGDRAIAATTLRIPHPYPIEAAKAWIEPLAGRWRSGQAAAFAIVRRSDDQLVGVVGLEIEREHEHAELGYWIGRLYWGCGYATEAAAAIVRFAFDTLGLHRVHAHHMAHNAASGRVLEKVGFVREGLLREHIRKDGAFVDLVVFGLTRSRYDDLHRHDDTREQP